MKGRKPNKAEKAWLDLIGQCGCMVCYIKRLGDSPSEVHHPTGKTTADAHLLAIPLCSRHHRHKSNDGEWVSRHGDGRAAFEKAYGTEADLLTATKVFLGALVGDGS